MRLLQSTATAFDSSDAARLDSLAASVVSLQSISAVITIVSLISVVIIRASG